MEIIAHLRLKENGGARIDKGAGFDHMLPLASRISGNRGDIFEVDLHLFQRLSWRQWLVTSSRWIEDQAFLP
jgi:hypothetical protein